MLLAPENQCIRRQQHLTPHIVSLLVVVERWVYGIRERQKNLKPDWKKKKMHPLTTTKRYLSESSQLVGKIVVSSASFNNNSRAFFVFLESLMVLSFVTDNKESASFWNPKVKNIYLSYKVVWGNDCPTVPSRQEIKGPICGFWTNIRKLKPKTKLHMLLPSSLGPEGPVLKSVWCFFVFNFLC